MEGTGVDCSTSHENRASTAPGAFRISSDLSEESGGGISELSGAEERERRDARIQRTLSDLLESRTVIDILEVFEDRSRLQNQENSDRRDQVASVSSQTEANV